MEDWNEPERPKRVGRVQELINKALRSRSTEAPRLQTETEVDLSTIETDSKSNRSQNKENVFALIAPSSQQRSISNSAGGHKLNKLSELKKYLASNLAEKRREEIETRRHVFNADNEIMDNSDEEEENYESNSNLNDDVDSVPSALDNDTEDLKFNENYGNEEIKSIVDSDQETYYEESEHETDEEDVDETNEPADDDHCSSYSRSEVDENSDQENVDSVQASELDSNSMPFKTMEDWTDKLAELSMDAPENANPEAPSSETQNDSELNFLLNDDAFMNVTDTQSLELAAQISGFDSAEPIEKVSTNGNQGHFFGHETVLEEASDEDESIVFRQTKRKHEFDSDDEDEHKSLDNVKTPKKMVRMTNFQDDLFTIDNGEDRLEMTAPRPFAERDTVRLIFDEDKDEDDEAPTTSKSNVKPMSQDSPSEIQSTVAEENVQLAKNKGLIEDEAELSGDEVDSSGPENEDDDAEDEYEEEAGDQDVLPDEEEMRTDLIKTHMKLQNIDEERNLNKLKEKFEGILDPSNKWDRSFRARLQDTNFDFSVLTNDPLTIGEEEPQEDVEEVEITFKQYLKQKEDEELQAEQVRLFSLAAAAEETSDDLTEVGVSSSQTKSKCSNPNALAKFIVDNYHL
ncbi:Mrpl-54 [Aphelenchoides besseyi]|nr:Mrpl-54 [Aphelenchoides besseyi]